MAKTSSFVNEIAATMQKLSKEYGYKVVSPSIAQACIESGFGNAWSRKNHNYFGIKYGTWVKRTAIADKLSVVMAQTKEEYKVGQLTTIVDGFVKCPDMETGLRLYFEFLKVNSRYSNLLSAKTPEEYCKMIKADGYATSSSYVTTLLNCITNYGLMAYDGSGTTVEKVKQYAVTIKVSTFLYVRTAPGGTETLKIGGAEMHLPNGMVVSICEEATVGSQKWGRITDVSNAWIALNYTK